MATWRRRYQGVPERLVSFRATEWPDAACIHEAIRQWETACMAWLAADSNRVPRPGHDEHSNRLWLAADSRRTLPLGVHGDALDVMRAAIQARRGVPPCPHEGQPAQWSRDTVRHT